MTLGTDQKVKYHYVLLVRRDLRWCPIDCETVRVLVVFVILIMYFCHSHHVFLSFSSCIFVILIMYFCHSHRVFSPNFVMYNCLFFTLYQLYFEFASYPTFYFTIIFFYFPSVLVSLSRAAIG